MLYDGKTPEELTNEELEQAAVYCTRMVEQARQVAELNKAGLIELALECERRLPCDASRLN
jgi:hypothetical protein